MPSPGSHLDWITALKSGANRKLADGGALQLDLFGERNLIAFTHDDFPAGSSSPAATPIWRGCVRPSATI
jgi:hypothetical protein